MSQVEGHVVKNELLADASGRAPAADAIVAGELLPVDALLGLRIAALVVVHLDVRRPTAHLEVLTHFGK